MARLYALLVGINGYDDAVGKLQGCLNDVENVRSYLTETWAPADLAIEMLTDEEATRPNVIAQFQSHLGQAGRGDVALFHYCGHGARARSAPEFAEFFPEGMDEGLVCIDSRRGDGLDLADKELAILIQDVAARDPHVAVILDCCHSGSGTRDADDFLGFLPRTTQEATGGRSLDSYVGGYYAAQRARGETLSIPAGRHILLAACERFQTAKETPDHQGVFTTALMKVLRSAGGSIAYPELFMRTRAAARIIAQQQDPQFETLGGFDAWTGFLDRGNAGARPRYYVSASDEGWQVECGAIHGLPIDADRGANFAIYSEEANAAALGMATALRVGAQRSDLALTFSADSALAYRAEITSLPAAPMIVGFSGDDASHATLTAVLSEPSADPIALSEVGQDRAHVLAIEDGKAVLRQRGTGAIIQTVAMPAGQNWQHEAAALLGHVARWERMLALGNSRSQIDPLLIDFDFDEIAPDGPIAHPENDATVRFVPRDGAWLPVDGKFRVGNRTGQMLHMALGYFSPDYGIYMLRNEEIPAGATNVTLWGDDKNDNFYLADGQAESIERFRLIVSTEKLDDFLLTQDALVMGGEQATMRALGSIQPMQKPIENDWFVKDRSIRVLRGLDVVGLSDVALAGGRIVVKAHPTVTATISLTEPDATTRSATGTGFVGALAESGISLVDIAGKRAAGGGTIIELTGIRNGGDLADTPLEILLDVRLAEGETLLPLSFDGTDLLVAGAVTRDADGRIAVGIDHVPDAGGSRDLGGALKMFVFKTVFRQKDVNLLRAVEYDAAGQASLASAELPQKTTAAKSILLLLHDIIGDSLSLAGQIRAIGLDSHFDLILGYDYENLNTPVEETARALKTQLAAAGLEGADDPRVTIIAQGLGGLVARWLVEQEGGAALVRHLVLCGTPSGGSPLGDVDQARQVLTALTAIAAKFFPTFIPYSSALLFAINQSKKITPTLEQMKAGSPLLTKLAAGDDPHVRITLLAGDVDSYHDAAANGFQQLLLKVAQGLPFDLLFTGQPHDMVASNVSVLGLDNRTPPPDRMTLACHHLNYFSSESGRKALAALDW